MYPPSSTVSAPARSPRIGGFSLIELLTVTAIIAILMGMIGSAAFAARQHAYRAQAQAEIRELTNAMKSYWITYGGWPPEIVPGSDNNAIKMSKALLQSLTGKIVSGDGSNARGIVFLEISDSQYGVANDGTPDMFLDPWGNAYEMFFSDGALARGSRFRTAVAFPMRNRYKHPASK